MKYENAMRWIIQTNYGVYTDDGWGYCTQRKTKEEAINNCEQWGWNEYRVYDNETGEIIASNPNAQGEDEETKEV